MHAEPCPQAGCRHRGVERIDENMRFFVLDLLACVMVIAGCGTCAIVLPAAVTPMPDKRGNVG
jgi:hypothetical protein